MLILPKDYNLQFQSLFCIDIRARQQPSNIVKMLQNFPVALIKLAIFSYRDWNLKRRKQYQPSE